MCLPGAGIHGQDTAPGAQRSVVQPESAQPVTPLCYGANPRLVEVLDEGPLHPPQGPRHSLSTQDRGPGTQSHSQTSLWPKSWCSCSLLCLGLNEAKRHVFACSRNKLERREKPQLQRLFQERNAAAQAQTQPREDQSPQLGPEPSTGVGQVQGDPPQVPATFPQLLTLPQLCSINT